MKGRREKENVTKSRKKRMLRKQEEEAENGKMRILRNGEKQREGITRLRKGEKQIEFTLESGEQRILREIESLLETTRVAIVRK